MTTDLRGAMPSASLRSDCRPSSQVETTSQSTCRHASRLTLMGAQWVLGRGALLAQDSVGGTVARRASRRQGVPAGIARTRFRLTSNTPAALLVGTDWKPPATGRDHIHPTSPVSLGACRWLRSQRLVSDSEQDNQGWVPLAPCGLSVFSAGSTRCCRLAGSGGDHETSLWRSHRHLRRMAGNCNRGMYFI